MPIQHQLTQHIQYNAKDILKVIKGKTPSEKRSRLSVYKNNVFHSLSAAMQEIFPVTRQMVGEECFQALCHLYISTAPPSGPVLSEYGHQFATLIARQAELADYPYLSELADLEYQLLQLTNQKEATLLTAEDIASQLDNLSLPPEQTHWQLASNVQLIKSDYRIGTLYKSISGNPESDKSVNWFENEWIVLCKNQLWGTFYTVSHNEWIVLKTLQQGEILSQATEHLPQEEWIPTFQSIIQKPLFVSIQ
ncbi:HvfC/BufC N-terminal domain-containing protein [Vibrio salinus]|uniref:HvfC/BufC N-terminal domain-containing protein n=1 Tax=Vibrio salinus TaxID=2899784 RepID=UPI001E41ABE9|nr:DNA-binding domain-containing protein [Vibrio salinus]MCE0493387.1 putative DNA-binding domain-containing protein [Vibrio salinus]